VTVVVRYFAVVRERLRRDSEAVSFAGKTAGDLLEQLITNNPALAPLRSALKVAVNHTFVELTHPLADGDEVALIPPVSGGVDVLARVTDAPLSLDEVIAAVACAENGGLVTFTGNVRGSNRGKAVARLEYEAYCEMAERQLHELIVEITGEWPGTRVAIVHRVGIVNVGEAAVVIAASAPHRKAAFSACEAAIDRLKARITIWKKEIATDGEYWVSSTP
jgi:molybdopterin converting factor subunit 1